ncbi:hypothetical protein G7092_05345 [Mucilaginibacter sp. HC2]|uniref:hypothetical protein n=1 Tax=Mucilaginibacter inviolabilis TaxID=2714892 RepID=UPI00140E8841|nr:hypothetical protein [Mucilaginibacter inviolabilis]NHA03205.1 hypothetical protein [Mucilaginibacter inviolabilis]
MKYYFRLSKNLLGTFGIVLVYLSIAIIQILRKSDHFYYYVGPILCLMLIYLFVNNYKSVMLGLRKKPLLEANETYVFDGVNNIKYYWIDIDVIDADEDNRTLYIKVNDPAKYLKFFSNFYIRYLYYSKRKERFNINLSCVKADMKNLITTLNNYSIQAQEIDGSKV